MRKRAGGWRRGEHQRRDNGIERRVVAALEADGARVRADQFRRGVAADRLDVFDVTLNIDAHRRDVLTDVSTAEREGGDIT